MAASGRPSFSAVEKPDGKQVEKASRWYLCVLGEGARNRKSVSTWALSVLRAERGEEGIRGMDSEVVVLRSWVGDLLDGDKVYMVG